MYRVTIILESEKNLDLELGEDSKLQTFQLIEMEDVKFEQETDAQQMYQSLRAKLKGEN